jgi:hypothetical protein
LKACTGGSGGPAAKRGEQEMGRSGVKVLKACTSGSGGPATKRGEQAMGRSGVKAYC